MIHDLAPILDHYSIDYRGDRTGNQPIRCPNTNGHRNGDRNPSASLHLERGVWKCQSCGEGGTGVDLIMTIEGIDLRAAITLAQNLSGEGSDEVSRQPGRSGLGLPGGSRSQRGNGKSVPAWRGFRT